MPNEKRKCTGGKGPPPIKAEKRPRTDHRLYSKICATANDGAAALRLNFCLQVAKRLLNVAPTAAAPYENVVCSPLAIAAVLNVLAAGSEGQTREQLLRVLERDSVDEVNDMASRLADVLREDDDKDAPDIKFANALWVADRLHLTEAFRDVLKNVYGTEARSVDFENQVDQVVKEANLWAEEQTKGLIKQILSRDSIGKDTMMILANALYFKGVWVDKFKPKHTKEGNFYLLDGSKVRAPFMRQWYTYFDYGTLEGCQILRMLYREGEREPSEKEENPRSFSMYIFLPNEKDGLPNLMENLAMDADMFKERVKLNEVRINEIRIPKFSFECDLSLSEPMKQLGLTLPFDRSGCELTGMLDNPNEGERPMSAAFFKSAAWKPMREGQKQRLS